MSLDTMRDYIYATPETVLANVKDAKNLVSKIVELYNKRNCQQIILVASGSSYTACQCAKGFIAKTLHVPVTVTFPFTFYNYDVQEVTDKDFVVIISQSGASTNCIEALKQLKEKGQPAYILTSDVNSDCSTYADEVLDWKCGHETVGYVTLGVVTLIVYLMLFASYAANGDVEECCHQIEKAMDLHKQVCASTETFIKDHYQSLMQMDRVYILGCGSNYGTALEGAIKIGETVKVLAVGYEQDEFLHGPALQLNPKYTVFVIDSNDHTIDHAKQVFNGLLKAVPRTYMITSQDIDHPHILKVDGGLDEPYTCLYNLPFFELIAEVISTDLNSKKSHPLYYEMNKVIDFRTQTFRQKVKAEDD